MTAPRWAFPLVGAAFLGLPALVLFALRRRARDADLRREGDDLYVGPAMMTMPEGQGVLVVDGDMGLANVDVLLRLSVKNNIRDILESGADPRQALIFARPNLAILPGSSGVPEMVSLGDEQQSKLAGFIKNVSSDFDYVVIDTAADGNEFTISA